MTIRVGQPGPDLAVEAYVRGAPHPVRLSLGGLRGHWTVLCFYPGDFTPVCASELQAFARLHDWFTREGATVLAASTDGYHAHKAWYESDARLRAVTYPVIADSGHHLAAAFGMLARDGSALRGTFILDPAGVVRHSQVNHAAVGRNAGETLRTLQALRRLAPVPLGRRRGWPTPSDRAVEEARGAQAAD